MNKNILVVDDEEVIRYVANEVFTSGGYNVFQAESGLEAVKIFENEEIHMFLMDLKLPGMNGIELCAKVRETRPIDFICAMTGFSSIYNLVQCRKVGFDEYFLKPFDNAEVLKIFGYAHERLTRWDGYCNRGAQAR